MAEIPIVAVYAYFLLGDRMTLDQIVGAVLVVAGVVMLSWPKRKRKRGGAKLDSAAT
jgi:drug/metabolite transporter (DMT)-like permease